MRWSIKINNNDKFKNLYNRLDNLLKGIIGVDDNKSMISYLERISPEQISSQLKTIRNYRNSIDGHGVLINGQSPIVPNLWIDFLEKEISFVKANSELVYNKILSLFKTYNNKKLKQTNMNTNKKNETHRDVINYGLQNIFSSYIVQQTSLMFDINNFRKKIEDEDTTALFLLKTLYNSAFSIDDCSKSRIVQEFDSDSDSWNYWEKHMIFSDKLKTSMKNIFRKPSREKFEEEILNYIYAEVMIYNTPREDLYKMIY